MVWSGQGFIAEWAAMLVVVVSTFLQRSTVERRDLPANRFRNRNAVLGRGGIGLIYRRQLDLDAAVFNREPLRPPFGLPPFAACLVGAPILGRDVRQVLSVQVRLWRGRGRPAPPHVPTVEFVGNAPLLRGLRRLEGLRGLWRVDRTVNLEPAAGRLPVFERLRHDPKLDANDLARFLVDLGTQPHAADLGDV